MGRPGENFDRSLFKWPLSTEMTMRINGTVVAQCMLGVTPEGITDSINEGGEKGDRDLILDPGTQMMARVTTPSRE
jgi:hypothetical protein